MSVKTISVETDASGDFTYERRLAGEIRCVTVTLGTLTTPDIVISDGIYAVTFLSVTGLAADARYQLVAAVQDDTGNDVAGAYAPPAILGSLKVVVSNGGANLKGTVRVLLA